MTTQFISRGTLLYLFWLPSIWLIVGLLASLLLARRPAKAHAVLVIALVGMMATPLAQLTVAYLGYGLLQPSQLETPPGSPTTQAPIRFDHDFNHVVATPSAVNSSPVGSVALEAELTAKEFHLQTLDRSKFGFWPTIRISTLLWSVWALMSVVLTMRLVGAMIKARRLVANRDSTCDVNLVKSLRTAATSLRLRNTPELGVAPIKSPVVWCWGHRPIVLVPFRARLDRTDWVAIFRHELAHWKRRDHVTSLLARVSVVLLPWNPLVWIVHRRLHELSEQVCDQWAVVDGGSPLDYAESLLSLQPEVRHSMALAAVSSRSLLAVRVRSLVQMGRTHPQIGRKWIVASAGLAILATMSLALAQNAPTKPRLEKDRQAEGQTASAEKQMTISGVVKLEDGSPAANAEVAVLTLLNRDLVEGNGPGVIGPTATDQNGRFELKAPAELSAQANHLSVVARAPRRALGWQHLELKNLQPKAEISLQKETPVRARLIDINGQPAAGVTLRVMSVGKLVDGWRDGVYLDSKRSEKLSLWPQSLKTDEQGWFVLTDSNDEQSVSLFTDDDRFARTDISIPDFENRSTGGNSASEHLFSVAPSQIVEGIVTADDTGEAIPHARVTIHSWSNNRGRPTRGVADAQGHFEFNPHAGSRMQVTAFAPDGQPFLAFQSSHEWPNGARRQTINVKLPRGVVVRGKLTEKDSGLPVDGATIEYVPRSRNPYVTEGIVTGWQTMLTSGSGGVFQLTVPPGEGTLVIKGPNGDYIPQEVGDLMIRHGQQGGTRNYPDALVSLNLAKDAKSFDVEAQLRCGVTVRAHLVGPDGQTVNKAVAIYTGRQLEWHSPEQISGEFELHGCDPDAEYRVMFLDAEHQWGTTAVISGRSGQTEPLTIRLQSCGTATARLLRRSEQPWADATMYPDLVVTPGPSRQNMGFHRGEFASESVINSIVDGLHYHPGPRSDKDGRIIYPALIPGATYRMVINKTMIISGGKEPNQFREWVAKAGENVDLGDMKYDNK